MEHKIFGEKIENIEYFQRKGAYLIAIKDNKLAVARCDKGCFLIGGGIEEGEDKLEGLKRECIEETGHEGIIEGYVGSAESYFLHEELNYFNPVQFYYYGRLDKKICEPLNEGEEFDWLPLENIERELVLDFQRWAVKKYLKHNLL